MTSVILPSPIPLLARDAHTSLAISIRRKLGYDKKNDFDRLRLSLQLSDLSIGIGIAPWEGLPFPVSNPRTTYPPFLPPRCYFHPPRRELRILVGHWETDARGAAFAYMLATTFMLVKSDWLISSTASHFSRLWACTLTVAELGPPPGRHAEYYSSPYVYQFLRVPNFNRGAPATFAERIIQFQIKSEGYCTCPVRIKKAGMFVALRMYKRIAKWI